MWHQVLCAAEDIDEIDLTRHVAKLAIDWLSENACDFRFVYRDRDDFESSRDEVGRYEVGRSLGKALAPDAQDCDAPGRREQLT
jgi:hypothetical protein